MLIRLLNIYEQRRRSVVNIGIIEGLTEGRGAENMQRASSGVGNAEELSPPPRQPTRSGWGSVVSPRRK